MRPSFSLQLSICVVLLVIMANPVFSQKFEIEKLNLPPDKQLSMITGIDQDEFGYLWLATHNDGLVRYDGRSFESFHPEIDLGTGVSSFLECIEIDRNGIIWVGDFASGLNAFDPVTSEFTTYLNSPDDPHSLSNNHTRFILEDSHGTLWIGTDIGVDTLDRATGKFYHVEGETAEFKRLSKAHIRIIYEDSDGDIWFGTGSPIEGDDPYPGNEGLFRFNHEQGSLKLYLSDKDDEQSLIDNRISVLFEDSRGVFWVGSARDGLHTFDKGTSKFKRLTSESEGEQNLSMPGFRPYDHENHIRVINEDSEGNIWIGALYTGLKVYNPRTNKVKTYARNGDESVRLDRDDHWVSFVSKDKTLWLGSAWVTSTMEDLLYKVNYRNIESFKVDLGNQAMAFLELDNGQLLVGGEGLYLVNPDGSYQQYLIREDLESTIGPNVIFGITKIDQDNFYISSVTGLFHFNLSNGKFQRVEGTDPIQTYVSYLKDDRLWIGTSLGLDILDLENNSLRHMHNQRGDSLKLRNRPVFRIIEDDHNNVWVCGIDGLFRFSPENLAPQIYTQNRVFGNIYLDPNNDLWATSESGLSKYNSEMDIFEMVVDSTLLLKEKQNRWGSLLIDNKLWLMNNLSLKVFDVNTKEAIELAPSFIRGDETLSNIMLRKTKSDEVLIGVEDGFYRFDLDEYQKGQSGPQPFVRQVMIFDQPLTSFDWNHMGSSGEREIVLAHDQNDLSFDLGNVDFISDNEEINIVYKLENHDLNWRTNYSGLGIYYYGLSPGFYKLRFKASNRFGLITEESLNIIITPPWYLTTWAYVSYALIFALGVFVVHKIQRARTIAQVKRRTEQKELEQAREIEKAYNELKTTQEQLVHSEKMASLGELTAGIAHEIQNPLNFVNNFSDVNGELIAELKEELKNGNKEEALQLAEDLEENESKITHHGKRAEEIVRSMLQHSRGSDGKKELTDINALADEYFRLAYHGMRAKDKSFNVELEDSFDKQVPEINVVPQDIGRVLLNLITNAFHTVSERKSKSESDYNPHVSIKSVLKEGVVVIIVEDNGAGIPDRIKAKVFEPFFSTKKTGQGTGLGLSLSYDIITKGHNGAIKVESTEGIGTKFIIELPLN